MNFKINEVYTFKLLSSEEIVAKVNKAEDDVVVISAPLAVAPNQGGIGLIPALFTSDPKNEFKLNLNAVAIISLTDENVKAKYIEATTGIKIPEKRLVLG